MNTNTILQSVFESVFAESNHPIKHPRRKGDLCYPKVRIRHFIKPGQGTSKHSPSFLPSFLHSFFSSFQFPGVQASRPKGEKERERERERMNPNYLERE
jgi:hypothetical protein